MCMPSDAEAIITQMGVQSRGGRWSDRWGGGQTEGVVALAENRLKAQA